MNLGEQSSDKMNVNGKYQNMYAIKMGRVLYPLGKERFIVPRTICGIVLAICLILLFLTLLFDFQWGIANSAWTTTITTISCGIFSFFCYYGLLLSSNNRLKNVNSQQRAVKMTTDSDCSFIKVPDTPLLTG